jgi:cystathionine beta-lyase/cystathionine gamma-synthase
LENILAKLEYGYDALAFSSGMAAITAMMELFRIGDHIISSDDLYGGSIRLFKTISEKNGITFDFINMSDLSEIKKHLRPETKAIYLETPSNPMMQVTDIAAVAEITKELGLLLIVDNTFLTPYFQNPLTLGADLVIHSGTKYLSGHNDTLAGFMIPKTRELSEKLRFIYKTTGACLAPFDSWLLIRGIKTLAIRMEKQQENAIRLAGWLAEHPKIKKVFYTGLKSHPDYELSKKQARGFGAMISIEVDEESTAVRLLEKVNLLLYAESLGGVETLITYPMLQTHADIPKEEREAKGINDRLLRISVGIESAEDIISDLEQALRDS